MGRKKSDVDFPRFTLKVDKNLYVLINQVACERGVKTYELINKLFILGIKEWGLVCSDPKTRISINSRKLTKSRKMAENLIEDNKSEGVSVLTIQMDKSLHSVLDETAAKLDIQGYKFMNKILLLGIDKWSHTTKFVNKKINIKSNRLKEARRMVKEVK